MKLRCNYISYLSAIDNFDQLYIIQQGGRGITREQIINRLKNVLNKGKNKDEVFEIVWNNETLRKNVFEGLSRKKALECFVKTSKVVITKCLTRF